MKKSLLIICMAIFVGCCIALYFFKGIRVSGKENEEIKYVEAKAFQIGVFSNYDNAQRIAERNNGLVVLDEGLYRVYVSVLSDSKAIELLSEYFKKIGLNHYIKPIVVGDDFVKEIEVYQELIRRNNEETFVTINKDILAVYQNNL